MGKTKRWIMNRIEEGYTRQDIYAMYSTFIEETGSRLGEDTFKRNVRKFTEDEFNLNGNSVQNQKKQQGSNMNEDTPPINKKRKILAKNKSQTSLEVSLRTYDIKDEQKIMEICDIDPSIWEVDTILTRASNNEKNPWFIFQCKFKKRNKKTLTQDEYRLLLKDAIVGIKPIVYPKIKYHTKSHDEGKLLMLSIMDAHLGQLSWEEETGEPYNLQIARELHANAVMSLLQRSVHKGFERILIVTGNDFYNSDGKAQTTTSGTPQMEDSRWQDSFNNGVCLMVDIIEYALQYAPVDVIIPKGNHDEERSYYMGVALEHRYYNAENVNILNSPTQRKYYTWGNSLLGFTHGCNEKKDSLPLIMSREQPEAWGRSKYYYWFLGHLHKEGSKHYNYLPHQEEMGVVIRNLPSLVAQDDWHNSKGAYRHMRASVALTLDENWGVISEERYNC